MRWRGKEEGKEEEGGGEKEEKEEGEGDKQQQQQEKGTETDGRCRDMLTNRGLGLCQGRQKENVT